MNDARELHGELTLPDDAQEVVETDQLLGESDWDDQDLLTTSDALGRVRAELEAERAKASPDDARISALEGADRRLTATLQPDELPESR